MPCPVRNVLLAILFLDLGTPGNAQSFTLTMGGASAQDGVGAVRHGDGYMVAVRDHDPLTYVFHGRTTVLSATGGAGSTIDLLFDGNVFLQGMRPGIDGSSFLFGSILPTTGTDQNGLLIKVDGAGAVLWSAQPVAGGSQLFLGAAPLPDGGLVVCGTTSANGGHDVLVARFSATGTMLWEHVEPGPTDAEAHDVVVDGSTVMLTGRQTTFSGTSDILLMRLDLNGGLVWSTAWGRSANEEGRSIIATGNGTFVIAGWTNSYGTYDPVISRIPNHIYLMSFDMNGDTLWTKAIGSTGFEHRAFSLTQAQNGDLFVGGERSTSGLSDAYLLRATASGAVVWERTMDTGKEERLLALVPVGNEIFGTGWSFSEFGRQILLVKRNSAGF